MPSISGKTLGTNGNNHIIIRIEIPTSTTGYIEIAHVSFVEGDASSELDPFSSRHVQQELAMCQRYFCRSHNGDKTSVTDAVSMIGVTTTLATGSILFPTTMRIIPTVTFFNPANSGAAGQIRWAGSNVTVSSSRVGTNGIHSIQAASGGTATSEAYFHYEADAEL